MMITVIVKVRVFWGITQNTIKIQVTQFLISIFFVPLFILRLVCSRFPLGSIPVSKLYYTVAGSAVVFYLSGTGFFPCSSPLTLWGYRLLDFWLELTYYPPDCAACPLFLVYCLLLLTLAFPNTGDNHQHAYRWHVDVIFVNIYCHLASYSFQINEIADFKLLFIVFWLPISPYILQKTTTTTTNCLIYFADKRSYQTK